VLRDVGVVHQPDAGADRALGQQQGRQVREEGLRAAEVAGREGGAAAPRQDRRQADRTAQGPGRIYRRQAGRPVQVGSLPLLISGRLRRGRRPEVNTRASKSPGAILGFLLAGAQGDAVIARGSMVWTSKATGRIAETPNVDFWRFRE